MSLNLQLYSYENVCGGSEARPEQQSHLVEMFGKCVQQTWVILEQGWRTQGLEGW